MGYGVFFGIIYKIIGIADPMVIRYINVISIALITFMLYKITNIIYKDERRNKIVILFSLLFIQFPLLSTFVYGDIIGLMFVLIAVYQTLCVIKKEKNKILHSVFAGISMGFAILVRTNYSIFLIATIIYLIFNIIKEIIKNFCVKFSIEKVIFFFDEACHNFIPRQQREFFSMFRDLRSPYICCKAAVYPGISYYSTLQLFHDVNSVVVERNINDENYINSMRDMVKCQIDDANLIKMLESQGQCFDSLIMCCDGNPRLLLKSIEQASNGFKSFKKKPALELPPPKPASDGIFFFKKILIFSFSFLLSSKNILYVLYKIFLSSVGIFLSEHSIFKSPKSE